MTTLVVAVIVFAAMCLLMAVGVMFSRKPLAGSCGGLAQLDVERACNCEQVCAEHSNVLYQIKEPE